jgi:hypothetical protein
VSDRPIRTRDPRGMARAAYELSQITDELELQVSTTAIDLASFDAASGDSGHIERVKNKLQEHTEFISKVRMTIGLLRSLSEGRCSWSADGTLVLYEQGRGGAEVPKEDVPELLDIIALVRDNTPRFKRGYRKILSRAYDDLVESMPQGSGASG